MCNRILFLTIAFLLSFFSDLTGQSLSKAHMDYIQKYKFIAIQEMQRAAVPASITLAQGILESNAGESWLAMESNNHFGIKCGSDWYGETIYKKDDDRNANGDLVLSCFRKYDSAEESFVAHSDFLHHPNKPWYKPLFQLAITDYVGWAKGLLKAGYATNPDYPQLLISLIERYALQQYDSGQAVLPPVAEADDDYLFINGLPYTIAKTGENLAAIAFRTDVSVRQLEKYNDGLEGGNQKLATGQIVFLKQKKWNNLETGSPYHIVKPGETMLGISQQYGISLFWLNFKNRMKEGQEPAIGSPIKLRGSRVNEQPAIATEKAAAQVPDYETEEVFVDWSAEPPANPVFPNITEIPERATAPEADTESSTPLHLTYTVKKGDTLWRISQQYQLSVETLKKLNNLSDNIISVGQELRVSR